MDISIGRFCAVCKFENEADATVCVNCQTPLKDDHTAQITTKRLTENTSVLSKKVIEDLIKSSMPEKGLTIYIINNNELIIVEEDHAELILGRKTADSIDTSSYLINVGAYDGFVSRRHAKIIKSNNGYEIMDMGSSNGTWMDKQRLIPNKLYPLHSSAQIQMGHIQVLIHHKPAQN